MGSKGILAAPSEGDIVLRRPCSPTASLPIAIALAATGDCTRPINCAPLKPGSIERLGCDAGHGDKNAQLALGIRYEQGDGVPRDLERARHLYARAARNTGTSNLVYSSPVGNENMAG
ncbi:hypothetical protein EAH87_06275 [Sphingomonas koreensis]|nr:hypothetical protein EAH87_06275 [Sphingomonas koreensis]